MRTFGPVPSRRLGRSLGINNITPKVCSYSCTYCQLGPTSHIDIERRPFYSPKTLFIEVEKKIEKVKETGESIDFLTFVPDGEPTLDLYLGQEINLLRQLGLKIAVITNGSLIWQRDVRNVLMMADWVSVKIDTIGKRIWRRINRPHRILRLEEILKGILLFAEDYQGELVTETMLVKDVNDGEKSIEELAEFITQLKPAKAYLSIPTRPPAVKSVHAPDEDDLNQAYQILSERIDTVEYLIGYEGNSFTLTGNVEDDLLGITSVHPMREEAVVEYLTKAKVDWTVIDKLIDENKLIETEYQNKKFYTRKIGAYT